MEVERIFSADQIKIHPELAKILREYTKATIRANPTDLLEFSWNYFKRKAEEQDRKQKPDLQKEAEEKAPDFDDI